MDPIVQNLLIGVAAAALPGGIGHFIDITKLLFRRGADEPMEQLEQRYAILDVLLLTALADGRLSEEELTLVQEEVASYEVNVQSHPLLRWRPVALALSNETLAERLESAVATLTGDEREQAFALAARMARLPEGGLPRQGGGGYRGGVATDPDALVALIARALGVDDARAQKIEADG